ncbi:uncharacterized protein TRIADDRAFT_51725 [Trichoplax adhaerens]|uniref:Uncharacterized protein n=1 Tax=Trichoplax adhaerens TaxID=10228 RepID=B3RKQ7_TRIAD|nr:hypothetical protein TRIADDRAFT_51725 [Trichoplax adhaerens]EDV28621.1 hypothetical protein TRIADDRAFT_51725 [Trichoplax adhaerens]|eukprot:XP_002107823.1 hypothetical protein TRIADDRAFT_51725 [Trichoplax adhaerens]
MSPLFEEFVELVFLDIQEAKTNSDHLENALRNKYEEYDNAMKSLFDEMEIQIIKEREKAKREEEVKERKIREKLQQELNERNRLLQEVINTKEKLRHRIEQLSNVEDEHKEEKERLLKENRDLSKLLKESQEIVKVRQRDIERLAEESEKQRKARIKTTLRMSAGLAKEHESLRTQLTKLQEMNQKLRDDKDALIHDSSPPATNGNRSIQASILPDSWKAENHSHINGQQKGSPTLAKRLVGGNRPLSRAGSLMSKYFPHGRKRQEPLRLPNEGQAKRNL